MLRAKIMKDIMTRQQYEERLGRFFALAIEHICVRLVTDSDRWTINGWLLLFNLALGGSNASIMVRYLHSGLLQPTHQHGHCRIAVAVASLPLVFFSTNSRTCCFRPNSSCTPSEADKDYGNDDGDGDNDGND